MPSFINIFNKRISDTGVKSKWEKVQSGLLFTPVSITTLIDTEIDTEDARFILNGISPIAKGDLKWRDALLVTGTVNSNQSGRMHKTGNPCDCQRIIENKKISD